MSGRDDSLMRTSKAKDVNGYTMVSVQLEPLLLCCHSSLKLWRGGQQRRPATR